jgi:hypothetical protein
MINAQDTSTPLSGNLFHGLMSHNSLESCTDNIELAPLAMDGLAGSMGDAKILQDFAG